MGVEGEEECDAVYVEAVRGFEKEVVGQVKGVKFAHMVGDQFMDYVVMKKLGGGEGAMDEVIKGGKLRKESAH